MRRVGLCGMLLAACFDPNDPPQDEPTTETGGSSTTGTAMSSSTTTVESDEGSTSSTGPSTESSSSSSTSGTTEVVSETESDTDVAVCTVDGLIGEGEQCDDNNELAGDGCSNCAIEEGFGCANEPSLCFPGCDPLVQDCSKGDGCYPLEPIFACVPDGSKAGGQLYAPCMNLNGCDPGHVCVLADEVSLCMPDGGCCTRICDLTDPSCADDLTCVPYYAEGSAPEGLDDVGFCR